MSAPLYRARALGMLGQDTYRNAMRYMSAEGWRTMEPGDRELGPPEAPLLLERGLRTVEVEAGHGLHQLIESAHLPLDDTVERVKGSSTPGPWWSCELRAPVARMVRACCALTGRSRPESRRRGMR
jgi:hypothetical protein